MLVSIERSKIDPHPLHGIVVGESELLLCLQREIDFELDGYVCVRKRDITDRIEGTATLKYHERLMRKERLLKAPTQFAKRLPLGGWHEVLVSLTGKAVLIENERKGDSWLGILRACTSSSATIQCFNATGVFDDNSIQVSLRSITAVQFGDRYTSIHFKYLKTTT